MNRESKIRNLKFLIGTLFFSLSFPVHAQQPTKVPQMGVLYTGLPGVTTLDAFRQGLRELGYAEGRNIVIEYRFAEGS